MILNPKRFNEFLKFKHCKLELIVDAFNVVTVGCYFGSVYLKDPYCSIPILSRHLPSQSKQWKYQNKVSNMCKVNNKDTRTTPVTLFWCHYC